MSLLEIFLFILFHLMKLIISSYWLYQILAIFFCFSWLVQNIKKVIQKLHLIQSFQIQCHTITIPNRILLLDFKGILFLLSLYLSSNSVPMIAKIIAPAINRKPIWVQRLIFLIQLTMIVFKLLFTKYYSLQF